MIPWVKGCSNPAVGWSTISSPAKDGNYHTDFNKLSHGSQERHRNSATAHSVLQDLQSEVSDVSGLQVNIPSLGTEILTKG